jgi:hypothetical protein
MVLVVSAPCLLNKYISQLLHWALKMFTVCAVVIYTSSIAGFVFCKVNALPFILLYK